MAEIHEMKAQLGAAVEEFTEMYDHNRQAQFAHSEALSYGEPVATEIENIATGSEFTKATESGENFKRNSEAAVARLAGVIGATKNCLGSLDTIQNDLWGIANPTVQVADKLKDWLPSYAAMRTNLTDAGAHTDNGRKSAEDALNILKEHDPQDSSPVGIIAQSTQDLIREAVRCRKEVGRARNILRDHKDTRVEKLDSDIRANAAKLIRGSEGFEDVASKIQAGLRLLEEGLTDLRTLNARMVTPIEAVAKDHQRVVTVESDVKTTVGILKESQESPRDLVIRSRDIIEQAKAVVEKL